MFGSDGDLVCSGARRLPFFPLLLVGDQSSLDEDVVQEDVDHNVVPGVDLSGDFLAATYDVLGIESRPCFAAPTRRLSLFSL